MEINVEKIKGHCQTESNSCIPMAVELILKYLKLMPQDQFFLQADSTKLENSEWIKLGFSYPVSNPRVIFSREYKLSDIGLDDRGLHFLRDYFNQLFDTIDNELANDRFVIISLESGLNQWHMEVIYDKVNDTEYKTITFYHNNKGPVIFGDKKLKEIVTQMKGTDILTYKWYEK